MVKNSITVIAVTVEHAAYDYTDSVENHELTEHTVVLIRVDDDLITRIAVVVCGSEVLFVHGTGAFVVVANGCYRLVKGTTFVGVLITTHHVAVYKAYTKLSC